MLKTIHAQEDLREALAKARNVEKKLVSMKLKKAAKLVNDGIEETLSYYRFPRGHWRHVKTNKLD